MKVAYGINHFKPLNKKPVVALGVFDGLHRGHQRIISRLIKEAKRLKTLSLIITFFPHPEKESSLYSLPHRLKLLEEAGVDLCLVIRFSPVFRRITAPKFLQKILIKKINPAEVIVGKNFTFGKHAQGDWQMLKSYSKKARFKLRVINVLTHKGASISSSYIRTLIKSGRLNRAQELLGRPVTIFGRVDRGCRLARILGYPTANINPDHETLPPFGVYAVKIRVASKLFSGICYIGDRPTVKKAIKKTTDKTNIEVHIFDFRNNLYGCKIQIEFIKKIRRQKRFNSTQALARQIKRDIRVLFKGIDSESRYPYSPQ